MKTILITGGAGFVGSSLARLFKAENSNNRIICLDNLKRRGSELNLPHLKDLGIEFLHGDIRIHSDIDAAGPFDLMIECSAEPSVLAGFGGSPEYLLSTNLTGTMHCLEACRKHDAELVFLSTSRVYPWRDIRGLDYVESETRFELMQEQRPPGVSTAGVTEAFPLNGPRTLYGATKLASEMLITEYADMYGLNAVINRCGVLAGAWQMGKVDQGFMVLWASRHFFGNPLTYLGFGGAGKQVRDILHVGDLFTLLRLQLEDMALHAGQVYNVGGGAEMSVSLKELTDIVEQAVGRRIVIGSDPDTRPGDIPWYVTDNSAVQNATGWGPVVTPREIVEEIVSWLDANAEILKRIL